MQATAATKVLLCQEILVEIFDYLSPGPPDENALPKDRLHRRESQRALARAARVCHAFSGPALNVLWRVTDSLTTLLSILPSFTLLPTKHYALTRDITDAEWTRFQEYARRVRELHTRSDLQISSSVWIFFSRRCPDGHGLIPRLQRLNALDVGHTQPGRILLLSPTLRHLSLVVEYASPRSTESAPIVGTIMELVRKISIPQLVGLHICSEGQLSVFNPETMPFTGLAHLQELEMVSDYAFDKDTLQALLAFPNLRKLTVRPLLLEEDAGQELTPGFLALRDLKVIGHTPSISRFLEWTSPPALESLALHFSDWHAQDSAPLMSATKFLRRLELRFMSYFIPSSLLTVLRPVLELDDMTHIAVKIEVLETELPVTDTELRTMADAWPNLVEFEIDVKEVDGGDETLPVVGRPSPAALHLFAERHPRLTRLVWPYVDMSGAQDLGGIPALDHGLQVLLLSIVAHDGLPQHRELAVLIDRLFPRLDLSDVQYPATARSYYGRQRYKNWCDVEQFLLAIRAGREKSCDT